MQVQTLNIALPQELLKKVDEQAKKEYKNRSGLIREALRMYLKDNERWEELFSYGRRMGKKAGVKSEKDVNKIVSDFRHGKTS